MSIVSRLFTGANRNNAITSINPLAQLITPSASGIAVTVEKALSVTTVFACLRVIAEGVAQVPLKLYQSKDGITKQEAKSLPLHELLYLKPNDWQTSFEFFENLIYQAGLLGNFYAFKNVVRGRLLSLIPFEPGTMTLEVDERRRITYKAQLINGEQKEFPSETIWHVRGPSWSTHVGMQAIYHAREAIGLALNIEETQNKLHANGVQTTGLLSVEGTLGDKQYKDLSDWVKEKIGGANKFAPFILDRNAKFQPVSWSGIDAQTLETRRFQIEEMCREFRVMPIMIGQSDKAATYASAEQMFLAHVVHTLSPWYRRIEQSIDANLLTKQEREQGIYAKFNANGLMRGAAKDRAEFYWKMYQMRALNPNQIRGYEDENPYEGGEEYYVAPGSQPMENTNDQQVP